MNNLHFNLLRLVINNTSLNSQDLTKSDGITKQGYLMKGPEIGSDRMFVHIGSKSFKRRYCHLRQEVDGTYILELFKDEKKGEAKLTIVMDFCSEVVRNTKRGRYCFELKMSGTHKSYCLAADNETELQDWLMKISSVLQHYKQQEEKRAASLERACNTPPPSPQPMQVRRWSILGEIHREIEPKTSFWPDVFFTNPKLSQNLIFCPREAKNCIKFSARR